MNFSKQFFLFGLVGTVGFVVDTTVLYLVRDAVGLYWGRLLSFMTSVLVTWVLNRRLTFADRRSDKPKQQELLIYFLLMSLGGIVNYCTYAFFISHNAMVQQQPAWGIAAGSLAGMLVNLWSARAFLFTIRR